ncbi:MAG: response regulator [candidate division WOR-3 bacterium]|nr:response regulator [candidate division WOR-3 bacterium]
MGDNKKRTILLVDDDIFLADLMAFTFKQSGFEIIKAHNGKEALEVLNKEDVDLVLTDIMMPVMDGFELTKNLKDDPNTKDIPVIFLTAKSNMEDKNKGYSLGISAYFEKPFDLKKLIDKINVIISENEK